ncbi:hypothetical protein [Azohydromonas lata]|uniref:hypothetical protein n=1 Tax=Azohydromonas lata TaxID=45677 RepID=UPI00082CED3E|nr:hypothetical protein [Azohydromonas lata]
MHASWAKAQTTTTGTGNLTLSALPGFPTPYQLMGSLPFAYTLLNSSNQPVEGGIATMSSSTVMVRSRVLRTWDGTTLTKNGGATAASLTGTTQVICTPLDATSEALMPTVDSTAGVGRYVTSAHRTTVTASASPTSLTVYYQAFLLRAGGIVTGFACNVTTAAASGGQALIGLYNLTPTGSIGSLISGASTSAFAVDTTGFKVLSAGTAQFLPPGMYIAAFLYSGSSLVTAGHNSAASALIGGSPFGLNGNANAPIEYRTETVGSLALPSSAGTTTASNIGSAAAVMLFVGVQ